MFIYLLLLLFSTIHCGRIIFNGMHASSSHIGSMLPVASRMERDGHQIHFLESNSKNQSYKYPGKIKNTYCKLPESVVLQKKILPAMWTFSYKSWDFPKVWLSGDQALVDMYNMHNEKLMDVFNTDWDLAIGDEIFAVASHALALKTREKGNPFIMMATCVQMNPMRYYLSLGGNNLHRPSMFATTNEHYEITSFYSRLVTLYDAAVIFPGIWYYTSHIATKGLKLLGYNDFRLSSLGRDTSYYFVDELNPLVWPASTGTEVLHVGYYCPEYKKQSLPEDYRAFLDDSTSKGTILIAFGTNVLWEHATKNITDAFVGAINRLKDYRFVFAFNGHMEQLVGVGKHCRVTNWAPQKEILNHQKTKVFVSHGGLKSLKDTICGTVPAVVMPLFAEQSHNAELARQMGIGEIISKYNTDEYTLTTAIMRLAGDEHYKDNVVRAKAFMLDRPASSLDLVSFATRRSLKYKKRFPTFKRKGMYLYMHEHYFFDLGLILITFVVLISY